MSSLTATQWNTAKVCKTFSLIYTNEKNKSTEWQFYIGSFCLVRHQGIDGVPPEDCTRDRYWKARIVEIRSPKRKSNTGEHYLQVQWFYSKNDIQQVKPKGVEDLDRYLASAAQQEIYLSNHESIISSEAIASALASSSLKKYKLNRFTAYLHDYEIIILDNTSLEHQPVVRYFSRFFWNCTDRCLQGSFTNCGLETCTALWNPDVEEQRFCWECESWFHTACLTTNCITTQAQHLEAICQEHPNVPQTILQIAFQPTARGGNLHYIAGNIRFVNKARLLLDHRVREDILSNPVPWMAANIVDFEDDENSLWWEYMVYEYNIDIGNKDTEQLVVTDQVLFKCPNCGPLTSL